MTRFFYAIVWIAALWQLGQGLTTGCFSVRKSGFVHCWADSPLFYGLDFAFLLFLLAWLPFLILSKTAAKKSLSSDHGFFQTRHFAARRHLNARWPRDEFASSRYCLANPGEEYLVYIPDDDRLDVYLEIEPKVFSVDWFNMLTRESVMGEPIRGGDTHHFTSPFGLESVLYLRRSDEA